MELIIHNIKKMIEISGDNDRLWPHIKTHKMSEVIKLQIKYGIKKFKLQYKNNLNTASISDETVIVLVDREASSVPKVVRVWHFTVVGCIRGVLSIPTT